MTLTAQPFTFEKIDSMTGRAKVPGGWIVKSEAFVYHTNMDGQGRCDEGWDTRVAMCFVPDTYHAWEIRQSPEHDTIGPHPKADAATLNIDAKRTIPKPYRGELEPDTTYYAACTTSIKGYSPVKWFRDGTLSSDLVESMRDNGLLHLSASNAEEQSRHLISLCYKT